MQFNDVTRIGPYTVKFLKVIKYRGPNYSAFRGNFVINDGQSVNQLGPELRLFDAQKMAVAKTAIHVRPFHDLYIALGEPLSRQAWSVRVYYKPFVRWIWVGGLFMMIGGFLAAWQAQKTGYKSQSYD